MKKNSKELSNKQYSNLIKVVAVAGIIIMLFWFFMLQNTNPVMTEEKNLNNPELENPPTTPNNPEIENPPTQSEETLPTNQGTVAIGGNIFTFSPAQVETLRPDIFKPGYFSIFDVLVQLNKQGDINLQYHFDETKNSHIIDSINNETDWWYEVYYSGGWSERNVFRPDHYPWKDQTTLAFHKESPLRIEKIYTVWEEEVTRKNNNQGITIVPMVEIRSQSFTETHENVVVTAHNLRNDVFKEGTITAIDVILSLEDQGKISAELQYYESIGTAGIVKSYWVEAINIDVASGRCGFVYEAGSTEFQFFSGNHIHLPSDTRVLNSPEYVEYFWICV
jgi:hypothetical protein